jgi:6-pyruvoyltetrahydropterin/6-carboxytetrahydropterin synthase
LTKRELIIRRHFDAAHKLENYKGECANLHGHRWLAEFHISIDKTKDGIGFDFNQVKIELDKIVPDHTYLNEIIPQPTAENLAEYLWNLAKKIYPVTKVIVWETPECAACYSR